MGFIEQIGKAFSRYNFQNVKNTIIKILVYGDHVSKICLTP